MCNCRFFDSPARHPVPFSPGYTQNRLNGNLHKILFKFCRFTMILNTEHFRGILQLQLRTFDHMIDSD